MFGRLAALILDHVRLATVLLVALVLGVSVFAVRLHADFSVESFFSSNDPEASYLADYAKVFKADDPLVVVIDGEGKSLLTRDRLKAIDALAQQIGENGDVASITSPTSLPPTGERVAGFFVPKPLLATLPPASAAPERLAKWRAKILSDPRFVPTFLSEDGKWGALIVELGVDPGDLVQVRRVVAHVEHLVDAASSHDNQAGGGDLGMGYRVAGVPAVRAHILDVMLGDQVIFVPVSGILILILLAYLFRSWHGVLIPAVAALVPSLMLFGWMGIVGAPIDLLNQIYLVLIPAIAVADAIHLLSRYHEEHFRLQAQHSPALRREAIIETMQHMGAACFLTSFTTLVGFLSLDMTRMHVLRQFGTYAGLGVVFAYLTVLLILPLTLWWTRDGARRIRHGLYDRLGRGLHEVARFAIRRPFVIHGGTALLVASALVAALRVHVDYALTETYGPHHSITIANTQVDEHLGGLLALELDLKAAPGTFDDPKVLAALEHEQDKLEERSQVRAAQGLASLLAFGSGMMGGPEHVPATPDLVTRVYTFAERYEGVDRMVTADHARSRMIVRTTDLGAADFEALAQEVSAQVQADLEPYGIQVHATGPSLLAYRGLARVAKDLRSSLLGAALIIGLVIGVLFRSALLGLLSLVPNIVPLVLGYGLLGVLGWSLDPAPAVVFSVALGLAVDSTIHVLARFREERFAGRPVAEAIEASVEHSGRAVTVTAVILVVGIGINMASSFPANVTFGFLGAFILIVALLANLVVLPALLAVAFAGRGAAASSAEGEAAPRSEAGRAAR